MSNNIVHFKPRTVVTPSMDPSPSNTYGCGVSFGAGILCTYDVYEVTCTACQKSRQYLWRKRYFENTRPLDAIEKLARKQYDV